MFDNNYLLEIRERAERTGIEDFSADENTYRKSEGKILFREDLGRDKLIKIHTNSMEQTQAVGNYLYTFGPRKIKTMIDLIFELREENKLLKKEAFWLAEQCATCADACSGTGACDNGECGIENCFMGRVEDFREAAREAAKKELSKCQ